jgi:hypothetical protein
MRFAPEADVKHLSPILSGFLGLVGWRPIEKRVTSLRDQARSNPFYARLFGRRYSLELAIADIREYHQRTGRCPEISTSELHRAYAFLVMTNRMHPLLGARGQKALIGGIRGSLESDAGLAPLAYELSIASHLMRKGCDVYFSDLEIGGGFDFLATLGGLAFEIECKHVSADIGRRIRLKELYTLANLILPSLRRYVEAGSASRVFRVTLPGTLSGSLGQQKEIADQIAQALMLEVDPPPTEYCLVKSEKLDLTDLPRDTAGVINQDAVETLLAEKHEATNAHTLLLSSPGKGTTCILVQSALADSVLDRIYRSLKSDSKRQFTAQRPAVLCVELADLTATELRQLHGAQDKARGTGIQRVVSALMNRRPHLHTVSLTVKDEMTTRSAIAGPSITRTYSDPGVSYSFSNSQHFAASDSRLLGLMNTL